MQQTKLYDTHVALGGRMVPFAGWELPVQYPTGPSVEHDAVRNAAGVFDIDHMGQFEVSGKDATAFLQFVQVYDIGEMAVWDAHYSLLVYEDGTIVDDIFLYRLPDRWMVVVNAANRSKLGRRVLDRVLGVHPAAPVPVYHSDTFRKREARRTRPALEPAATPGTTGRVALFSTCYCNRNEPDIDVDLVAVFD